MNEERIGPGPLHVYTPLEREVEKVQAELARVREEFAQSNRVLGEYAGRENDYKDAIKLAAKRADALQAELGEVKRSHDGWQTDAKVYCQNAGYWRDRCNKAEAELDALKAKTATPMGEPDVRQTTALMNDVCTIVCRWDEHQALVAYLRFQLAAANERADAAQTDRLATIGDLARYQTMVSRIRAAIKMAEEGKDDAE